MKALAVEALDPFTGQRRTHKRDALPALYGHQTPECGTQLLWVIYICLHQRMLRAMASHSILWMLRTVDCDCHGVGKDGSFLADGTPAEDMLGEAAHMAI